MTLIPQITPHLGQIFPLPTSFPMRKRNAAWLTSTKGYFAAFYWKEHSHIRNVVFFLAFPLCWTAYNNKKKTRRCPMLYMFKLLVRKLTARTPLQKWWEICTTLLSFSWSRGGSLSLVTPWPTTISVCRVWPSSEVASAISWWLAHTLQLPESANEGL